MHHTMRLEPSSFDAVRAGVKVLEMRLYDEKRQQIQVGDTIEFRRDPEQHESVRTSVVELLRAQTFRELASEFPATLFGHPDTEHLLTSTSRFYTREQEEQYGVLGIRMHLVRE